MLPGNKMAAGTKAGQDTTGAAITSTKTPCNGVLVQNDPDNSVDILVGDSAAQTIQLTPGSSIWIAIDDASKVFTKTVSSTATINFLSLTTGAN
jgi:hypothetical protein